MIPQGYPLVIELVLDPPQRFLVVGWQSFGDYVRPYVIAIDGQDSTRAIVLPADEPWRPVMHPA